MFPWDARKAEPNTAKHGVAFEEAATIFVDPDGLDWEDRAHSRQERRAKPLRRSITGRILLVVCSVSRVSHGRETIRIISARRASRKERKAYAGQPD
jgi:hypothetical protein